MDDRDDKTHLHNSKDNSYFIKEEINEEENVLNVKNLIHVLLNKKYLIKSQLSK